MAHRLGVEAPVAPVMWLWGDMAMTLSSVVRINPVIRAGLPPNLSKRKPCEEWGQKEVEGIHELMGET